MEITNDSRESNSINSDTLHCQNLGYATLHLLQGRPVKRLAFLILKIQAYRKGYGMPCKWNIEAVVGKRTHFWRGAIIAYADYGYARALDQSNDLSHATSLVA